MLKFLEGVGCAAACILAPVALYLYQWSKNWTW